MVFCSSLSFASARASTVTNRSWMSGLIRALAVICPTPSPSRSLAAIAKKAQEEHKEVDEVEIKGQGADDGIGPHLPRGQGKGHLLQTLRVPGGQPGEDDHADHRYQELKGRAVPE